jgi:signal transduction histidine kinase
MRLGRNKFGTGRGGGAWPVLLILLTALAPSACVLWFMNAAMQNERLAGRQRLTDVYRKKVQDDQNEIAAFWAARMQLPAAGRPAELFAAIVRAGLADSAIIRGGDGAIAYPSARPASVTTPTSASLPTSQVAEDVGDLWANAESLEYAQAKPAEAAGLYAKLAAAQADADTQARALLAQARCLAKAGGDQQAGVLKIVKVDLSQEKYRNAVDAQGRLIVPNAQLLALELAGLARAGAQTQPAEFQEIAAALRRRLADYNDGAMSAGQRMFLMKALQDDLHVYAFDTLAAEGLAADYLQVPEPAAENLRVTPTSLPGLWQLASDDGRAILLFREDKLVADLKSACKLDEPFVGITTVLELPGRPGAGGEPFLAVPVSASFPGWQLVVYLEEDPFTASAAKAETAYLAGGIAAIAVIALLAVAMASYMGRQIRLTRLKNDLIATVSHELKTPLASMRVLVDTLREGRCTDSRQAGEYFELIARENERLSRLIDNFLTFSRMERNKRAFEFQALDVAEAVRLAVAAAGERFAGPDARLEVDLPANLPKVWADRDAIVTVILNLLDNAWKYSGDRKIVRVRAFAADGSVCLAISDNGVGMGRRAMRRIFDKFYQVDQTLSRKAGGCGLGLSIVKFILDAHGGSISVASQVGKGSEFTVYLPSDAKSAANGANIA